MFKKIIFFLFLTVSPMILFGQYGEYVLVEKEQAEPSFVYFSIALAVCLLAASKFINTEIFGQFFTGFVSIKKLKILLKEGWSALKYGGWLWLLNYFLSVSLCLYLLLERTEVNLLLSFSAVVYYFFGIFFLVIVGVLSARMKVFLTLIRSYHVVHQVLGLALMVLSLVWVLNPQYSQIFVLIFISLFIVFQGYKIIRSFAIAMTHNFEWYYIILYLCTLEILPILVLMRYLGADF